MQKIKNYLCTRITTTTKNLQTMNYQLANKPSLNLEKKDLIQKLVAKNLKETKITCLMCEGTPDDPNSGIF